MILSSFAFGSLQTRISRYWQFFGDALRNPFTDGIWQPKNKTTRTFKGKFGTFSAPARAPWEHFVAGLSIPPLRSLKFEGNNFTPLRKYRRIFIPLRINKIQTIPYYNSFPFFWLGSQLGLWHTVIKYFAKMMSDKFNWYNYNVYIKKSC